MNREQRRAFDKRHRHGDYDVCPKCGMPSEFIAFQVKLGACVPVCIRCGRIAGRQVEGLVHNSRVRLSDLKKNGEPDAK